jgi:uncharacterized membrane protein YvlD (DUF360 family)
MRFLLRVLVSAAAVGVAIAAVPGIELTGNGRPRAATLLAVADIFGLINTS